MASISNFITPAVTGGGGGAGGGILREFEITQPLGVVTLPQEIVDSVTTNGSHLVQLLMVGSGEFRGARTPNVGGWYGVSGTGAPAENIYRGGEVVSYSFEITPDLWFNDAAGEVYCQIGQTSRSEGDRTITIFGIQNTIDTPTAEGNDPLGNLTVADDFNVFRSGIDQPFQPSTVNSENVILTTLTVQNSGSPTLLSWAADAEQTDTAPPNNQPRRTNSRSVVTHTFDGAAPTVTGGGTFGTATTARFNNNGQVTQAGALTPWFRDRNGADDAQFSRYVIDINGVVTLENPEPAGTNGRTLAMTRMYNQILPDYTNLPNPLNYARSPVGAATPQLQQAIIGYRSNPNSQQGYFGGYGAAAPSGLMAPNTGGAEASGVIKIFY